MAKKSKRSDGSDISLQVSLTQTLNWIDEGEKIQKGWAARTGKVATKMADSFEKHLRKLRKQATKLEKLTKVQSS
jgi:hypothetical protein